MARKDLKPNTRGLYERSIGWKHKPEFRSGYIQHKFYLGRDAIKAQIAELRLEQLWAQVEARWKSERDHGLTMETRPVWEPWTLAMGSAIAKGDSTCVIEPNPDLIGRPELQARWFAKLVTDFPVIALKPANEAEIEIGREHDLNDAKNYWALSRRIESNVGSSASGQMLHAALDDYIKHLKTVYQTPPDKDGKRQPTGWCITQVGQAERLKDRHDDIPLSALSLTKIESFINLWRSRPHVRGETRPIGRRTARNQIKQLKHFLKWLNRNERYEWRRPADLQDLETTVELTPLEKAALLTPAQVETFDLEELILLYQYATPVYRLLILLGLNCGSGAAESGSLLRNQVFLRQQHPFAKLLHYDSSGDDSFIKRIRIKSSVYGEWKLWPLTVQALEWAMARCPDQSPTGLLLRSRQGKSLIAPTKGGNHSSRIGNGWFNLIGRLQKDHQTFPERSFGKLRKTAGNLIRRFSDGEISGVFLCHGQPVESDSLQDIYTNRPFGKVFDAIDELGKYLQSLFTAVENPFPAEELKGGPNITRGQIIRIRRMKKEGFKISKIAEVVGVARTTVYRNLK